MSYSGGSKKLPALYNKLSAVNTYQVNKSGQAEALPGFQHATVIGAWMSVADLFNVSTQVLTTNGILPSASPWDGR